jgi:hypothetical protein
MPGPRRLPVRRDGGDQDGDAVRRQLGGHVPDTGDVGVAVLPAEAEVPREIRADLVAVQQLESVSPSEQVGPEGTHQCGLPRAGEPGEPDHEAGLRGLRQRRPDPTGRRGVGRGPACAPGGAVRALIGASQHLGDLWPHELRRHVLARGQHLPDSGAR